MPNPYEDLSNAYPNLTGTNQAVSGDILSQLKGQLSPQTIQMIQNAGATYGVGSGMPGSGLSKNLTLRDLGLASEDVQQKGIQNYNATLPTVSATQTVNPALQAEINSANAVNAAAPNPQMAASYAQGLFQEYLDKLNPSGGTISWSGRAGSGKGDISDPRVLGDYVRWMNA